MPDSAAAIPPIGRDETLYRRIPEATDWYKPSVSAVPSHYAFMPNKEDAKGISLWRADFKLIEDAAKNKPGKRYYVAVLLASDFLDLGMTVATDLECTPSDGTEADAAHAIVPELRVTTKKDKLTIERARALANRCQMDGPFLTPLQPPGGTSATD